jgi:hypothetical protein
MSLNRGFRTRQATGYLIRSTPTLCALLAAFVLSASVIGCTATASRQTASSHSPAKVTEAQRRHEAKVLARERATARLAARRERLRAAFVQRAAAERAEVPTTTTSFEGTYFAVDYPSGWSVEASEVSKGGYLDTTIRSSLDANKMLRVDVEPETAADTWTRAREVESSLARQSGYRALGFTATTFQGYDSVRWEFLVAEHGVLLHKVDIFFTDDVGDSFALLTQAPASSYRYWSALYADLQNSFVASDVTSPSSTPASDLDFCSTHECINNFDNGVGYIVQCADGMWSHSGGRPGACSYHGGETSNTYGGDYSNPTPTYSNNGADLGPGNGSTVVCADGSISHSGGVPGACSHHGGVGP